MCDNLRKKGRATNQHLCDELLKASLKKIYESLKGTVADPLISPDAAKMAQSIRAVLNSHAESIRFLPDAGEPFSIKDWIKRDNGEASILFITAQYAHLDMSRSLLTLRSEEHTSELQSLMRISYAVFCLKQITKIKQKISTPNQNRTTTHI